jgi:hypothetical protein
MVSQYAVVQHHCLKTACTDKHNPGEDSTPTRGSDAFRANSPHDRRFGSLGLNLVFEGLLLG